MFYESRRTPPPLPKPWAPVGHLFQRGAIRAAYDAAFGRADPIGEALASPRVALLLGDIYRATGQERRFRKLIEAAADYHEEDLRLRVQWIRVLCMRGRLLAALRELEALEERAQGPWRMLTLALRISILAQMQRTRPAKKAIRKLRAVKDGLEEPLRAYEVGYAHYELREWEEGLKLFELAAERCPAWPRPRLFLHRCLSALGRYEEAREGLAEAVATFPEDTPLLFTRLGDLFARRQWAPLLETADAYLSTNPVSPGDEETFNPRKTLRAIRLRACWNLGRREEALAEARELSPELAQQLSEVSPEAETRSLDLVPIVQDKNMCVAASVAMVLHRDGQHVDPAEIYAQMDGRMGVASWQLDRWLIERGLQPVDLAIDLDAIRALIDAGIPLLATRSHVIQAHMEVIVGYDDAFRELEIMDPAEGLPAHIPYDALERTYGQAASSLVALIPQGAVDVLAPGQRHEERGIRRLVLRSLWAGDIAGARREFSRLPEVGITSDWLRLGYPEVFLTEGTQKDIALRIARNPEADLSSRLQSCLGLLSMGAGDEAKDALADLRSQLTPFFRAFLRMTRARGNGDWKRMRRCCEILLERAAVLANTWHSYSIALEGCGEFQSAREARTTCLEIEPEHVEACVSLVRAPRRGFTVKNRLARVEAILEHHPRSEQLRALAAKLAYDLGRPERAEEHLREGLRLGPLSVPAHLALRSFYLWQNRPDLAETVVLPRQKVPDEEAVDVSTADASTLFCMAQDELLADAPGAGWAQLEARQQQGTLTSDEDLELRSQQVIRHLSSERATDVSELRSFLPQTLPQPRAHHIEVFLDRLPPATKPVAVALLDWTHKQMRRDEWTPELRLECAQLEEQAGDNAAASKLYTKLVDEHGLPGALFNMGRIELKRGKPRDAIACLEACVERAPANSSAWQFLAALYERLGEPAAQQRALDTLVRLAPLDPAPAHQLLSFLISDEALGREAEGWLERHGGRYTEVFRQWWRVRFLLIKERWGSVLKSIGPELREANPRDAIGFELEAYVGMGTLHLHADRVLAALTEFPEDGFFCYLTAALEEERDPTRARDLYLRSLAGSPDPQIVLKVVILTQPNEVSRRLFEAIVALEPDSLERFQLLNASFQVLSGVGFLHGCLDLFERLEKATPQDPQVLKLLLEIHGLANLDSQNEPIVTELLRIDPDDPGIMWTCARALQRVTPSVALDLFIRFHDKTNDPSALPQMGHCHQIMGRTDDAISLYREGLELLKEEGDPLAVTNLFLLGVPPASLIESCRRSLHAPPRSLTAHFARIAVHIAIATKITLPAAWEEWATTRAQQLVQQPTTRDSEEAKELRSMLQLWCRKRGSTQLLEEIYGETGGVLKSLKVRFTPWGRNQAWIPVAVG